jgi:hypothetical protein
VNEIFPGFENALIQAGGVRVSVARDIRFEHPEIGRLPQRELGSSLVCASRPLLELVLRQKAQGITNLEIRSGCRVISIESELSSANVRGVRFIDQSGVSSSIDADLVVDASGRSALTAALFDTLRLEQPETTAIDVNLYYTSTVIEMPERASKNWKLVLTLDDPPRMGERSSAGSDGTQPLDGDDLSTRQARADSGMGQICVGLPGPDRANHLRCASPSQTR